MLNALVASRFLKPLMPKSWHFTSHAHSWQPVAGDMVAVTLADSGEQAQLLVVESGENAALCLLAQSALTVAGKGMQLGDAIKIMNDRLQPQLRRAARPSPARCSAYASSISPFGIQLQLRMVPSPRTALCFSAFTSPDTSVILQLPQIPARHE